MTQEERLLLEGLKANTKQLFQEFSRLEDEKKLLEDRVLELEQEIGKLEEAKSELGHKNEQLEIASHILSGVDVNREAKGKINNLVREIDKCIALLNR